MLNRNVLDRHSQGGNVDAGLKDTRRRWVALLLLGLLLQAMAMVNSDLGLDAHIRLNAMADESTESQTLAWGKLRLANSTEQQPGVPGTYSGYIPPWFTSEAAIKFTAFVSLIALAALASLQPRWKGEEWSVQPIWAMLILYSPVMLFATGRGYDEATLALIVGAGASGFYFNNGDSTPHLRLHVVLLATTLLALMGWKGFSMLPSLLVWLAVVMGGFLWIEVHRRLAVRVEVPWTQHPWLMGGVVGGLVFVGIFIVGFFRQSGTFSIIGQSPLAFLMASVFALLDTVVLYLLLGTALWPLVKQRWTMLRDVRDPGLTLLVVYVCGVLGGLIAYIGALWTLESNLWGLGLPETMVRLGNNGRYATCLLIPIMLILKWVDHPQSPLASPPSGQLKLAAVLLPLMLFTTVIGHQIWSEDAGEALSEEWGQGDDAFLLIAPEAMAMHHLYIIKTHVDLDGSLGIAGYWRDAEQAFTFLEQEEGGIDFVLIAPNIVLEMDEEHWVLVEQQDVPVHVPGGIQEGSWKLYRGVT